MSSISGSCSESQSSQLFQKGIEEIQQRQLETQKASEKTSVEETQQATAGQQTPAQGSEDGKGIFIDLYA